MSTIDDDSLGSPPASEVPADWAGYPPPPAPRRKRVTKGRVAIGILLLIIVFAVVASFISLPYYALTPGSAQSVGRLITVPASLNHNHRGSVSLVDVEETPLRLIDFLFFKLDSEATIVSSQELQGPETNAQYYTEGVLDMQNAQQAAQVVALRVLGYKISVADNGALVYALDPGSPADASLAIGDVISRVDSSKVVALQNLTNALHGLPPGSHVTLTYRDYPKGSTAQANVQLGAWRLEGSGNNAQVACVSVTANSSLPYLGEKNGQLFEYKKGQKVVPVACLGLLSTEQSYAVSKLPFAINLNSEGIVGPSAGLAFTLGLIQKLDAADLTGGIKVACTGTMSIDGQVGEIGGIKQKTYAVRNAGDKVFLVPPGNFAEAKKYAGPDLKVYAVSTIQQALRILESYGGKVQKPTGAP